MLSPVFMRDERNLGRLAHEKLRVFREVKKDSVLVNGLYTPLGLPVSGEQKRLSTYGAQEKVKNTNFITKR